MKHWKIRVSKTKYSRHSTLYPVRGENRSEAIKDFCETYPEVASNTANKSVKVSPAYGGGFSSYRGGYIQQ